MKHLQQLEGRTLELSQYEITKQFYVYALGNYDFHDNLDFGDVPGVYIFTKRDMDTTIPNGYNKQMYQHELIYCGASEELDGRFCGHFHAKEIQDMGATHISIHLCSNKDESFELEELVLSKLKFPVNEKGNDNPKFPNVKKVVEAF